MATDRLTGYNGDVALKVPCRVATTSAITLSGLQTVDGTVLVEGDRVLVKNQTDTATNGIYIASAGAWPRSADCDGARDLVGGTIVTVTSGTATGGLFLKLQGEGVKTPGVDALLWSAWGPYAGNSSQTFSVAPATTGTMAPEANQLIGRNLIVNGSCQVDQVQSGALINPLVSGSYIVDNYPYSQSQTGKLSGQQITTSSLNTLGATHAIRLTVLSQFTPGAGDYFQNLVCVEGLNLAHLMWGTTNASSVSLQFKAIASVSGTYSGAILNVSGSKSYPFTYSLVANVPTLVKIESIPGCPDGVWVSNNTNALYVSFCCGTGSTYGAPSSGSWLSGNYGGVLGTTNLVAQTAGSTLDISDVQLEKGMFCTTFERKLYSDVLKDCQRYYEVGPNEIWSGNVTSGSLYYSNISYKVTKRISPAISYVDISDSGFPTTAPILTAPNVSSFQTYKTANATVNGGYYQYSWAASARL